MMKKVMSIVLSDKDARWIKVTEDIIIPTNVPLTVRIFDPNIIVDESDDHVVYAEERRIAIYTDDKKWSICGPFPKYNFSTLVDDDGNLRENVYVSHYEIAKPKDIAAYQHRLDNLIKWKYLDIKVDPREEASVYRAFTFMQDVIKQYYALSQFGEPSPDLKTMSELSIGLLHDLISIIDMGYHIENEVSEIDKNNNESLKEDDSESEKSFDELDKDEELNDETIDKVIDEVREQDENIYHSIKKGLEEAIDMTKDDKIINTYLNSVGCEIASNEKQSEDNNICCDCDKNYNHSPFCKNCENNNDNNKFSQGKKSDEKIKENCIVKNDDNAKKVSYESPKVDDDTDSFSS